MYSVNNVLVLGAGEMGSGSTAVFAQESHVYLLNRAPIERAQRGLEAAISAARSNSLRANITVGTYENDLEKAISEADFIYETLAEDLDLKRHYFKIIDQHRRTGSIVATASSGLSVAAMAEGMSADFRKHFLGVHLFNPPIRLTAAEIIPTAETAPEVVAYIEEVMEKKFHRVVLRAADVPGYAGNRIGFKVLNEAAQLAEEHGVDMIEYLFGGYTGRALPPLATIDLVGWDVHQAIVDNIYEKTSDEAHESFKLPEYMAQLIKEGTLGNKTPDRGGFTRRVDSRTLVLDPGSGEYREPRQIRVDFVEEAQGRIHVGDYRGALKAVFTAKGKEAAIVRRLLLGYISYAGMRVGEISDARGINRVMGWGFNWVPPDALVDALGVETTRQLLQEEGLPIPEHLKNAPNKGKLYREIDDFGRYFSAR